MKRFFALLLALLMVLSLTACVSSNNAAQTTATETAALSPEAAAEQAAAETKDTTSLSDIIRVPFGYLLDWLYVFSSNYGVALILFSLIVKLVLLPMSIKSKKSMLKMSRLAPLARSIEAKYGDDRQKAQMAVQQMYKEEGVSMFYLELSTGLRRGELVALLWSDLNLQTKTLTVSKSVSRGKGELVVTEPKTENSVREIYLSDEAIRLLVEDRKNHPFSPYMFPSPKTCGMYGPDCIGRIHKKLLEKAGIEEHVRFHDLRHTFSTLAIQSGIDPKTVAEILGHASAEFSLDVYTHVTAGMKKEAAQKISGFMASVG